jgi:biotin carboxyl carrier protein
LIKAIHNNEIASITSSLLSSYAVISNNGDSIVLEKDGVKYNCRLLFHDTENNSIIIKVNGAKVAVDLKKEVDFILESFGISGDSTQSINELKAPMPGVVLDIKIAPGDEIKKGDPLIILEAMKMENVLSAPVDCIISSIEVKKKETVEKNTLLIKFK